MALRAVIFDMDGLMLDTERMVLNAFRAAGERLGCEVNDSMMRSLIGRNAQASWQIIANFYGPGFPLEQFRAAIAEVYAAEIEEKGIPVKEGLTELLDALRAAAIPHGIATSTAHERARWKLAQVGLDGHFEVVVGGDQVTHSKPAPDIFIAAAGELGVPPAACIALEDSPHGIQAATQAGMTAIMVPDLVPPDAATRALAHAVVEDLHAARSLIATLTRA